MRRPDRPTTKMINDKNMVLVHFKKNTLLVRPSVPCSLTVWCVSSCHHDVLSVISHYLVPDVQSEQASLDEKQHHGRF